MSEVACDVHAARPRYLSEKSVIRLKEQSKAVLPYRYTGEKILDKRVDKGLLEASWQPAPVGTYPDLPQSPRAQASSAGRASTSAAPPQKQGHLPCLTHACSGLALPWLACNVLK